MRGIRGKLIKNFRSGLLGALVMLFAMSCDFSTIEYTGKIEKGGTSGGNAEPSISVSALYSNAPNWNDYVKKTFGQDDYNASDVVCDGTENGGYGVCIHGGEKKVVDVPYETDCSNLSITDNLDAFEWVCDDTGDNVQFFTRRLRPSVRLADLINHGSPQGTWKDMSVTISVSGTATYSSSATKWWNNDIYELPVNSTAGLMDLPHAAGLTNPIYTLDADRADSGYNINGDKVGFAISSGATLSFNGSAQNCNNSATAAGTDERCVLISNGQKFLWIEGRLSSQASTRADYGISLESTSFTMLRNVNLYRSSELNLKLGGKNIYAYRVQGIEGGSNSNSRCTTIATKFSTFEELEIISCHNYARSLRVDSASFNIFHRLKVVNGNNNGLDVFRDSTEKNIFSQVLVANSGGGYGVFLNDSEGATYTHITSVNNAGEGFDINDNQVLVQLLAANNQDGGFDFGTTNFSEPTEFHNIASLNNRGYGILSDADNFTVHGSLLVDGNTLGSCSVTGGVNPGIEDITCTDSGVDGSNTYSSSSSDAILRSTKDISNSFVEKVVADSTNNSPFDGSGQILHDDITDWYQFDHFFRYWGESHSDNFPSSNHIGPCSGGTETCQMWDFSLSSTDTQILNRSGDGENANASFVVGSPCPAAVNGDVAVTDYEREVMNDGDGDEDGHCDGGENCYQNTFLVNALEIRHDDIGDDDTLCESGEACIYSPNFGAYQGHGGLTSGTCIFNANGGPVTDVSMYAWKQNGR